MENESRNIPPIDLLNEVLENTSDAIVALDKEWIYTYVNSKAAEIFGRKPDQLLGKNIWDEFPEGIGQDFYHTYHRVARTGVPEKIEAYYPPWEKWFENRIQPFKGGVLILFHEITDRKIKELQLVRMNSLLTASQQVGKMGTWVWDINERQGWLSVTMYELLGYFSTEHDITLKDFLENIHPADRKRIEVMIRSKLKKPKDFCTEFRMFDQAGNIRYFRNEAKLYYDHLGNPEKLIGITIDTTESEHDKNKIKEFNKELATRVEERTRELAQAKSSLQALIENTNDGIWSVNSDKILTTYNSAFNRSYQLYSGNELREGMHLKEILDPKIYHRDFSYWDDMVNKVLLGEEFSSEYEIELAGKKYTFLISCHPIRLGDKITGATFFSKDISQRIQSEKKIIGLNEDLLQKINELKEINEDLNSFTYSVSHDLRAPLRAITGYSEILKNHLDENLSDEDSNLLNRIIRSAKKMDALILDLMAFSRISKKEVVKERINMNNLVQAVSREVLEDHGINNDIIKIEDLPDATADYNLLSQVFYNLIANAVKFSSKQKDPGITVGAVKKNGKVYYFVKDNGIGFDIKYKEKIFNVFVRLNSEDSFEGTGVGLAIVKRIISKHGGCIEAISEPGKGATFYVYLNGDEGQLKS